MKGTCSTVGSSTTRAAARSAAVGDRFRSFGRRVGRAEGRNVAWDDVEIRANGDPITGLSLCCARDPAFGAKLVCPGHGFAVGDRVEVELHPTDDPIRLG